jgi:anti-sigma factor RsiW
MIHWSARCRLADLVDGGLPEAVEARVRGHVQGCARCRRVLRGLEESERLLRALPTVLAPLEESRAAEARLVGLARWAPEPPPLWPQRVGTSAIGLVAVAAAAVLMTVTSSWTPLVGDPSRAVTVASLSPEARTYAPMGWR